MAGPATVSGILEQLQDIVGDQLQVGGGWCAGGDCQPVAVAHHSAAALCRRRRRLPLAHPPSLPAFPLPRS